MDDELGKKTQDTADQLFGKGIKMDPPYLTWKEFDRDLANDLSLFIVGKLYLAVAKKRSKREMSVLENLYSGTFSLLATLFPSILQESPQVTSHVTHKTLKNPLWKGLEVHSSPFSMQR